MISEKNKERLRTIGAYALIVAMAGGPYVLARKTSKGNSDCPIDGTHVHKYVCDDMLNRYYLCESDLMDNYTKTNEYLSVDKDELDKRIFEAKHGLFRISENEEYIKSISAMQHYKEYQCYHKTGDNPDDIVNVVITNSLDPKDDSITSTGLVRDVTTSYRAYKIVYDRYGQMIKIPSNYYASFADIPSKYEYFCVNDVMKVTKSEFYPLDKINSKKRTLER